MLPCPPNKGEDDCMSVTRMEKFVVSAIYLLMAASAARLFIAGISNPNSSRFQDIKLLLAASLAGAVTLFLSAILIHHRPAKAYVTAMVALQLLVLAFFPLFAPFILEVLIHRTLSFSTYGVTDLFPIVLLAAIAIFTPLRLYKLVSC
jgi:uncharacterized membrane protein YsdA (DUF1294 family)